MTPNRRPLSDDPAVLLGECIGALVVILLVWALAAGLAVLAAWAIVSLWPGLSLAPVAALAFVVILLLMHGRR